MYFFFQKIHLLDAGCGTASYSLKLLQAGIGRISIFDASDKMLDVARAKLESFRQKNQIGDIKCDAMPNIPFTDECFDVVMINMVNIQVLLCTCHNSSDSVQVYITPGMPNIPFTDECFDVVMVNIWDMLCTCHNLADSVQVYITQSMPNVVLWWKGV